MAVFYIVWGSWFLSEIGIHSLFRTKVSDKKNMDKGSKTIIWISIVLGNSLGVIFINLVKAPISSLSVIPYPGLFLIVVGMGIRFLSIWQLRNFFTVNVTIKQQHQLITSGLYSLIRHPSYTGMLLSFFGFGISLNNWVSLLVIMSFVLVAIHHRIKIEEKGLQTYFGAAYSEYSKKTFRFIPWVY